MSPLCGCEAFSDDIFAFNRDNKKEVIRNGVSIGTYYYDGEGKRIKKVVGSETTVFVYSSGKLIAEYSTETPPQIPTTSYTITDHLGSPRIIVNALGEVVSRRDFMPFGEEVVADGTYRTTSRKYGQSDRVRQRFTGYQKDEETQLDFAEARMYENRNGRFTAVDPLLASGKSADPQTFNRYVYVLNNPLILTDPSGLQAGTEASQTIYPCAGGPSACEYTVNEAQRKITVNTRSLATVTVTAEPDLIGPSLSCIGGDSACGSGNIVFRSPLTQGASAGEVLEFIDNAATVAGQIPVVGEPIDLFVGGGVSLLQGHYGDAGLSVIAAIPGPIGNAAGITKLASKGARLADEVHGNSKLSTKAQHGYEIFPTGERAKVVDTGVSGGSVTKDGKRSYRANSKLSKMNKSHPGTYDAEIVKTLSSGPAARGKILDWEKKNSDKHRGTLDDRFHKRP